MKREDREFYQRIAGYGGGGLGKGCGPTLMCFIILIVLCLIGCKQTEYVPVVETHTETVHHHDTVKQVDSTHTEITTIIREVDSAMMAQYGIQLKAQERAFLIQTDKLQKEISRLKEIQRDSVAKQDSVPKIVINEVEKKQSFWDRIHMFFSDVVMFLIIFIVLYTVYWLMKNRLRW